MGTLVKRIIWDWNGTLLDDVDLCVAILNQLCTARGLPPLDREAYRERFSFPITAFYNALGFDVSSPAFDTLAKEWGTAYEQAFNQRTRLFPGCRETLEQLSEMHVAQSILSAHHQDTLIRHVTQAGIAHFFNPILGLGNFRGDSKIAIGQAWLDETGESPDAIVMVGDTLHDFEVAQALGIRCVLIPNGHQSRARLQHTGVSLLDSIQDIPQWVSSCSR